MNVQKKEITEELQDSYLSYAMSVIVARALPDCRDGLKPAHRRILYDMYEMGLRHTAKHLKCARIVGDVLGNYHPHGDQAVYDTLVRMAQPFSYRYPLINGQGNFGSIDGDSAAAYRYTEAKLTQLSEEMCKDLEKETVDFVPNYDGRAKEPVVLPAALPHLLLNGSVGIAVGMATNIPPHNLKEVIDASVYFVDNPDAGNDDLLQFVVGPDFPTGGIIFGKKAINEAYSVGKGTIPLRGKAEIEERKNEQFNIVISEIPYQVNKSDFLEKIAALVQDKKIEGIKDVRDESDKDGIRIIIELKTGAMPQKVLNCLYKFTDLQKDFHLNLLALVDGIQPQTLSLREILAEYLKHREVIVKRRAQFDLKKAEERAHILLGLSRALRRIDAIIKTIKSSATKEDAHSKLVKIYKLSDIQAQAILEMKLQALAGLERKKIDDELAEKTKLIGELKSLLSSSKKIKELIKKELLELKEKYGDERKTKVVNSGIAEFKEEDLVAAQEAVITLSRDGYIKRFSPDILKTQKRGGRGIIGFQSKEEDLVVHFAIANTHDNMLFFTDRGRVFQTKAYEIPEAQRTSRGKLIHNFLDIAESEKISAIIAYGNSRINADTGKKQSVNLRQSAYLVMATKDGVIKKTAIEDFSSVRKSGLLAIKLRESDDLRWVKFSSGDDEILLASSSGTAIRFSEKDIRPMSRQASGVKGMKIGKEDELSGMEIIQALSKGKELENDLLILMENGFGKKTKLKEFKKQKRGGRGIKAAKITSKTGKMIFAKILTDEEELLAISKKGQILKTPLFGISRLGRATQGVRIIKLEKEDGLAGAVCL